MQVSAAGLFKYVWNFCEQQALKGQFISNKKKDDQDIIANETNDLWT